MAERQAKARARVEGARQTQVRVAEEARQAFAEREKQMEAKR